MKINYYNRQNKGITLIALVITIIILLILAAIAIQALTNTGLFAKAKDAKIKAEIGREIEQIKLSVMAVQTSDYESENISYDKLKDELIKYKDIDNNGVTTTNSIEDGAKLVSKANDKINIKNLFMSVSMAADVNAEFAKITYNSGRIYYVKLISGGSKPDDKIGSIYTDSNNILNNGGASGGQKPETPADPTKTPATSTTGAQSDDMLTKTVNSTIEDANGNKITIPAGFKIKADDTTNNATTVDKGIVIIDSNENEFVWIPVGKIYTDTAKTEANARTIGFNRYTFDSNGNPTAQNDAVIDSFYQELATSTYGNTTAEDINVFKTSVTTYGGYYIGRYEARKNSSGNITEKSSDSVWNYINQLDASTQAKNMYKDATAFTSDLMNSYAWDTATLFLQTCGTNSKYSKQTSINTGSIATTGTNNQTSKKDVQCNVYDMASNVVEWTTESASFSTSPCVLRGGSIDAKDGYTGKRYPGTTSGGFNTYGFRTLLYINLKNSSTEDNTQAGSGEGTGDNSGETSSSEMEKTPATSIAGAQTDDMLNKTVNSPIADAYGNEIIIPAGFKIKADTSTNNATTVDKGIVIVDNNENEFVWIPVGKIYTDTARTEANAKTIGFNRYTFDSDGTPIAQNDNVIEKYYQELEPSTVFVTAKDINAFKTSVETNKGYYISRYEARTATDRTYGDYTLTAVTTKGTDYVYNFVTQMQAADLARNMYDNTKPFTSDLANSYAWDTATLFLQTCGTNSKYSIQKIGYNVSVAIKGTNNETKKDVQCNVYDMASNIYEWTTEYSSLRLTGNLLYPSVCRARGWDSDGNYVSDRNSWTGGECYDYCGFRPILYL